MFYEGKRGSLSPPEKKIVKRLLDDGFSNQDVLAKINFGRHKSVNPARIAEVKNDHSQAPANGDELFLFDLFKKAYDPKTGLNPYKHERLVKSREAMLSAVSVFNNPTLQFRTEQFLVLSIIAWTYLAHEYCERNGMPTERKDGKAISLADFLKNKKCPLEEGVKNNINALIKLRNEVEHRILGGEDPGWFGLFQANCLNYEKFLTEKFGAELSLGKDISFALQFSGLGIMQIEKMAKMPLPNKIKAINADLYSGLTEEQRNDQSFILKVIYTTVASSKSKAAIQFISPKSKEGKEISSVLVKHRPSDETHPYKPSDVVKLVKERTKRKFNMRDHTNAWKKYKVRPDGKAADPAKTKLEYCYYNPTFKSYTYSERWVDFLVEKIGKSDSK